MNKALPMIATLLLGIGLSACGPFTSSHKSKDENCGTLEVCNGSHIHHNSRKHYDRH